MAHQFLERNKKKGLLAALLLFLRRRKALSLLLLVVLLASMIVVTPSYLLIDLPGAGPALVAGVAWMASKAGVDTSSWGLEGKSSFRDLMTAFRAAKTAGASRSVGWGTLFGRAPQRAAPNSLDMVKGSRKDLGSPLAGVKGVLTAEETKAGRDGVAIAEGDLTGQRRESFLGGVMKGLFGAGNAELSGGAFVSKGFFDGSASAGSRPTDRAQAALDSTGKVNVPKSSTAGRVSTVHVKAVNTRSIAGGRAARSLGDNLALTQLAESKGRATMATEECVPPACPHEFAAAQTGAIYDGNAIDNVGVLSGGEDTPTTLPEDDLGGAGDAANLAECATKAQQCQTDKAPDLERMGELQTQLNDLFTQMSGACCGDPCSCGGCNSLKDQIRSICGGELQTVIAKVKAACDLPSYCSDLGITDPSTSSAGATEDMCKMDMCDCGCDDIMCDVGCFLGGGS